MKISEMLEDLAYNDKPRDGIEFDLLQLHLGRHDKLAAQLLIWIENSLLDPTQDTVGDIDEILDAAKWWHTLFSSLYKPETK